MKSVTTKMIVSLAGLLLVAPFFAVALIVGSRAVSLSQGTQDDLLLVALALAGAAASLVNGLGRGVANGQPAGGQQAEESSDARPHGASVIHLGY